MVMSTTQVNAALWALGVREPAAQYENRGREVVATSPTDDWKNKSKFVFAQVQLEAEGRPSRQELQKLARELIDLGG